MMTEDCQKMNIVNGKLKSSKNNLDNLRDFVERWENKIKEIKNIALDNKQGYYILKDFIDEAIEKREIWQLKNTKQILNQLQNDLYIAIFQSFNNYKKQFPGYVIMFLQQSKLPDINLVKL